MSKSKFQHYVPKFYLNGFADTSGMVWVFDKLKNSIFSSKPEGIAGENYFYDVPELESSIGLNQPLEKAFWPHENEASQVIEYIDRAIFEEDFPPLHKNNRDVLAMHLALQTVRTPKYRELLVEFFNQSDDEELGPLKQIFNSDKRMIHAYTFANDEFINMLSEMISGQIWLFARNGTDVPFYSSDNPVLYKTKDNKLWTSPKLPTEHGIQLVFPISPDCLLYVMEKEYWSSVTSYDGKISPVKFTEYMVEHENSGQVAMSKRFIFSCRNDFMFAKSYCSTHPEMFEPNEKIENA
jgi:hypothetical protein